MIPFSLFTKREERRVKREERKVKDILADVFFGGNNRARTCDPLLVRQVLSQLSYAPVSVIHYNTEISFVKEKI